MKLVKKPIYLSEISQMSKAMFGDLVKAVVDVDRKLMALDAEMHADEEAYLLENGSKQQDLWGINIYPDKQGEEFIEFDSMINLRPSQNNRSRSVDNPEVREQISEIVNNLVKR